MTTHQWTWDEVEQENIPYYELDGFIKLTDDKIIQFMKKLLRRPLEPRERCVWFYREVNHPTHCITKGGVAPISNKFRFDEAEGPVVYAVGCVETIRGQMSHQDKRRLYLLGYIKSDSIELQLAPSVSTGYNVNGLKLQEDAVLVSCSHLCRGGEREINEEPPERLEDAMEMLLRDEPNKWVYIFRHNPPSNSNVDLRFFKNMDVDYVTMHRLHVMIKIHRSVKTRGDSMKTYQHQSLPIDSYDHMQRDRICSHVLVLAACQDEKLCNWLVEAEGLLLTNNLSALTDYDDRMLNLIKNGVGLPKDAVDLWNSVETRILQLQQHNLEVALEHAKTYMESLGDLPETTPGDQAFKHLIDSLKTTMQIRV